MTDNFSRQEPIKESGHAPDETLGDTFQFLNEQLLAERVKMQALLKEKEDLQKSRAYRFIRWFWQLRMKVIPNGSKLAKYLSLGPQEISSDETTGHQFISDLAYRYSTDSADGKFYAFARKLNTDLCAMVNKIPQDEIDILWSSLESVLVDKYRATPSDLEAWYWHRYRIYLIIKELEAMIDPKVPEFQVLEMGGENPCTDLYRQRFPNTIWNNTQGDLRHMWEFDSNCIDLVISTEVLEHLQDIPVGYQDSFTGSGLTAALRESFRVLKPGGLLFFTTPNAASIWHLRNCLLGDEPWFLKSHIREYTLPELKQFVESVGFTTQRTDTIHCMTIDFGIDYSEVFALLIDYKFATADRGDDIFYLAYKPKNP